MIVEQFLPAFHYGDAIGNSALSFHRFLLEKGVQSRIIAMTIDECLRDQATFFKEYKDTLGGPMVYRIKRLTISNRDNRKRMITEIFAPAWVIEGIDLEQLRYSAVYETVAQLKGFKAAHAHETIRPWICDKANGELLGVAAGMPLFHRTSVATDKENRILFIRETLTTANILVMESDLE